MSADKNSYTNIRRAASGDKNVFIIEKQDFIGIPLKEDEAEYVCRTLALYLGLSIVDQRENIKKLNILADKQESKEEQIGA